MAAVQGMLTRLAIDSSSIGAGSPMFDYQLCTISLAEQFPDCNGQRGTLSHDVSRQTTGIRRVGGQLRMEPNASEMGLLLPWVLGTAGSGSGTVTYALSDSLLSRNIQIDKGIAGSSVGKVATYNTVGVDHATFSASQGEPLTLGLDLVGLDESIGTSFSSTTAINVATSPWMFQQCALTVNSVSVNARTFEVSISNFIDTGRFFNSATLVSLVKRDRIVTFRTEVPYGDFVALYNLGAVGIAVVATFTNGSNVLTMTMANVGIPRTSPVVSGRQESMLSLFGQCYASGATKELVVTVAS